MSHLLQLEGFTMSINYIDGATISFLQSYSKDDPNVIPFNVEIENIYHAYRRCYSKDPFADVPVEKQDRDKLKAKFIEYFEATVSGDQFFGEASLYFKDERFAKGQGEDYLNRLLQFYGEDAYYNFLYQCNFIKAHLNHESPFEHASLTVSIDGVSRSFTHQWVRSRIASHSQASQRYIGEKSGTLDIILPYKIADNPEAKAIVNAYFEQMPDIISKLADLGIKNEDIRCIFPNAMATGIVSTMNFREWKHLFELRISSHAQAEIRNVSYQIWSFLNESIPLIWANAWDRKVKE